MPRRKRDHLKRAIANAISYTQDAASWVIVLHDQFAGVHDDYAAYLALILQVQAQSKAMLVDFWKKALGTDEVPWETYTTIKTAFEPKQLATVQGREKHGRGRLKKKYTVYFDLPEEPPENTDLGNG
jgi:hypothetical protein